MYIRGPSTTNKEPVIEEAHTPRKSLAKKPVKMRNKPDMPVTTFIKTHSSASCPLLMASIYIMRLAKMVRTYMTAQKNHSTGSHMSWAGKA